MMLDQLVPGLRVQRSGEQPLEVFAVTWLGAFAEVTFKSASGDFEQILLDETDAKAFSVADESEGPYAGDSETWKIGVESLRVANAALVEPMLAVASSQLRPLPHQLEAVYGHMLPRPRLRFLLADDPGAGKTIMCGLYIKEQMLRGELSRCLIVAPGSLVEQWQRELSEKFGLRFSILSRDLADSTPGSVFEDYPLLLARMDMLSRGEDLMELAEESSWDLVVVDEAHRMSAGVVAQRQLDPTKRYQLGARLGKLTRHLLLMTATPHTGDQQAFQAFLALLDEDRFNLRHPMPGPPPEDVMRRMLKEELLTLDGKALFPERRAATVQYSLSVGEMRLYEEVSEYVRFEMDRVKRMKAGGAKRAATAVGFALTVLQRRLASSPEAILRTLERRRDRLSARRDELELGASPKIPAVEDAYGNGWDLKLAELEERENELVDHASTAQTIAEIEFEIVTLKRLVSIAREVRSAGEDRKWLELRSILEDDERTRDDLGRPRKIIIFTEHRDTLRYLADRISYLPTRSAGVVEIHGGLPHRKRRDIQHRFVSDPEVTVLLATDAAGEGLNLQAAHLMVNYDLPWNPNRIDQRFGRIHRIGQTEVCHLWNLVAADTREGAVYLRLLEKLESQAVAYRGRVFDVLGDAFTKTALADLMTEAIEYGDDPAVRARLDRVIDETVSEGIPRLLKERALYRDVLQQVDVERARENMEEGARTRLQPHFLADWVEVSLGLVGGRARKLGSRPLEIAHVPEEVRAAASHAGRGPLAKSYRQVTFEPLDQKNESLAQVIGVGHPLIDAMAEVARSHAEPDLLRGVVLVDEDPTKMVPRVLAVVQHEVRDGNTPPASLSREIRFVELFDDDGHVDAELSYLDYRPASSEELPIAQALLAGHPHLRDGATLAKIWAMKNLVPEHVANVRQTRDAEVQRTRVEISRRLDLTEREEPSARNAQLVERLGFRLRELDGQAQVKPLPVKLLAIALVVPAFLLCSDTAAAWSQEERAAALSAVIEEETRLGRQIRLTADGEVPLIRAVDENGETWWTEIRSVDGSDGTWSVKRTDLIAGQNLAGRHQVAMIKQSTSGLEIRRSVNPFAKVGRGGFQQPRVAVRWAGLWSAAKKRP